MQFHLNGYKIGDPLMHEPHASISGRPDGLPEEVDVLIIGCGPAGMVLGAQMANFPEITTAIIDRRDVPLEIGQADGVACRTVEMFQAFGLAEKLVDEAYWVNEVCFWQTDSDDPSRITRTGRIRDTEEGLSEFPHVIVNQARMLTYLQEYMERSASRLKPSFGYHASAVEVDPTGSSDHPVTVTLQHMKDWEETGETSVIRAKYVVGCDGSRSVTRTSIGRDLIGDITNESWGVMDALTVTDFPDIRRKCAISSQEGNILIIPREGGYLTRFYVELETVTDRGISERNNLSPEVLTEVTNRILHPYSIDLKGVGWWSVYEITQRLCDKFDDVDPGYEAGQLPRVFIAGDACHTHSAKAGQGMNVSMNDAWNLGWKLASVLTGRAKPELLHTYSEERQVVAKELIDFDREFSRRFRARGLGVDGTEEARVDPDEFERYFVAEGRFTAGVATHYLPSMLTATTEFQNLATGFPVGMRFHSAPALRFADAKPVHLGHVAEADGAWRIFIFADRENPLGEGSRFRGLCDFLASDDSPIVRFTPHDADPDSVIDVRAIFQQSPHEFDLADLPSVLLPRKGRFGLVDHEKVFCSTSLDEDVFDLRGVNREHGCIVVSRPDQYISHVLPLEAHEQLASFFDGILIESAIAARAGSEPQP